MPGNQSQQKSAILPLVALAGLAMQFSGSLRSFKIQRFWVFLLICTSFIERARSDSFKTTIQSDMHTDRSVNVGDINGDGIDDIIIGAPSRLGYSGKGYLIYGSMNYPLIRSYQENSSGNHTPIDGDATGHMFLNRCPINTTKLTFTGWGHSSDTYIIGATPPNWNTVIRGLEISRNNLRNRRFADYIDITTQKINRLDQIELVNKGQDSELLFPSGHVVRIVGVNWETILNYHRRNNLFVNNYNQDKLSKYHKQMDLLNNRAIPSLTTLSSGGWITSWEKFQDDNQSDSSFPEDIQGLSYPHVKVTYRGNPGTPDLFRLLPLPTRHTIISHFDSVPPLGLTADSIELTSFGFASLGQIKISVNSMQANLTFPNGHLLQLLQINPIPLLKRFDYKNPTESHFKFNDWPLDGLLQLENYPSEGVAIDEILRDATEHQIQAKNVGEFPLSSASNVLPTFSFQDIEGYWHLGLPEWLSHNSVNSTLVASSEAQVGTTLLHADWKSEFKMERQWVKITVLPALTWWQWLTRNESLTILTVLIMLSYAARYVQQKRQTRQLSVRFFQKINDYRVISTGDIDGIYQEYKAVKDCYLQNSNLYFVKLLKTSITDFLRFDFSDKELLNRQKIFSMLKDYYTESSLRRPTEKIGREVIAEIIFNCLAKEFCDLNTYGQLRGFVRLNGLGAELNSIEINLLTKFFTSNFLRVITDANLIAEDQAAVTNWNQFINSIDENIAFYDESKLNGGIFPGNDERSNHTYDSHLTFFQYKSAIFIYAFELLYVKGIKLENQPENPPQHALISLNKS